MNINIGLKSVAAKAVTAATVPTPLVWCLHVLSSTQSWWMVDLYITEAEIIAHTTVHFSCFGLSYLNSDPLELIFQQWLKI